MRSVLAIVSGLAALAQAYTTPTTQIAGDGNSIFTPGLNQAVPAGTPFNITWKPTTPSTVTIVLMRGPGDNIKPLYPIAEQIPNSGSFLWTPKTDLEPDVTHYGLQLIDDATGQYQWSTQFGISNPNYSAGSGSASASTPSASAASTSGTSSATGASGSTPSASYVPSNGTSLAPTKAASSSTTLATGATRTVSSTRSATTASVSTVASNAAGLQKVGSALGLVGGVVAVLAL